MQGISSEIGEIASRSREMSSGAEIISRSSGEAAAGASQVSEQITRMSGLVGYTAERATALRESATQLMELSRNLNGLVASFKTA